MARSEKNTKRHSVAQQIIAGLQEAIAFERGDLTGVRVDKIALTARHVSAVAARGMKPAQIVDLRRRKMRVSQAVFAQALNVNPETVRAWEQGKNSPGGAALRLLEIADEEPGLVLKRVHLSQPLGGGRTQIPVVRDSFPGGVSHRPKVLAAKRNPAIARKK